MNSLVLILLVLGVLAAGYGLYGRLLSRLFGLDPARPTPAHEKFDGVDYVPAKHWWALFGHHFSSICGAGPIVGPALAVAYWGWVPAVVWILVGVVFMGAVSDFSSLVLSVRHGGVSVPEVTAKIVSPRARFVFSLFIWLALVLVIAVFAILAAKTFARSPAIVVPAWGILPAAVLVGWMLYARKMTLLLPTLVGLGVMGFLMWGGGKVPVSLPSVAGLSPERLWILILLVYCFVASVTPVQYLLQPRDYLASYLLIGAIGLGILGIFVTHPPMQAPAFTQWAPPEWAGAGPLWPMLFVTIACGAISGFHCLVSGGTTGKQLSSEAHACRIGYGGMLTEGLVGVLVVICVGAGLSASQHAALLKGPGPIGAFSQGYGSLTGIFLKGYGAVFAVMALNAFLLTTLDTATRIGRYLTSELFGIQNRFAATALVVAVSGAIGLSGQWAKIWPAFGTANQLIAALALLVVSCWLMAQKKPHWYTLGPAVIMLLTTVTAFAYQIHNSLTRMIDGAWRPDWFLSGVGLLLVGLSLYVFWEAAVNVRRLRRS